MMGRFHGPGGSLVLVSLLAGKAHLMSKERRIAARAAREKLPREVIHGS